MMLSQLSVLCFVTLIISCLSQKSLSGLPCHTRQGKVVGGMDAVRGETPYIVSLTRRGGHFCGASIINEKWVLTAGHCLCNGLNKIMKAGQIKGVFGLHKISEIKTQSQGFQPIEMSFSSVHVHPEYNCNDIANDIALLELEKEIGFKKEISPICLPTSDTITPGNSGTVSGWGWTDEDQSKGVRSDTLQQAKVEFWDNDKCSESFKSQNKPLNLRQTQMCAGKTGGGVDSCWADSGGPLVNDQNVLVGVVSTGVGCARPGLPGIYTRVFEYLNWIDSVVQKN